MKDKTKNIFPLDQHEDPKTIWRRFYEDTIRDNLDTLNLLNEEIGTLQRIRESFSGNRRIKDLCESILQEIKEEAQLIKKEIEYARTKIKEFS